MYTTFSHLCTNYITYTFVKFVIYWLLVPKMFVVFSMREMTSQANCNLLNSEYLENVRDNLLKY